MAVLFDASILIDLFNPRLSGPRRARIDHLVDTLIRQKTSVLVPTPAFTEVLVHAGRTRQTIYEQLTRSPQFRLEAFDARAALECSLLLAQAWQQRQHRQITHTKFKFDWQIVSIAASRSATAIYSDDKDVERAALSVRIPVFAVDSLPLPPEAAQGRIDFDVSSSP